MHSMESGSLAQFYASKVVFITGVTGFIGKALVEKLLRSCSDVEIIYVLVRGKRNQSGEERLQEILKTKLFERVAEQENSQSLMRKVVPVTGDVTLPSLGISSEDWEILQPAVSVVFHIAANVKLNDKLERLLKVNTEGTKNMIEWCKRLENMKAFVYVSTAFSNSGREEILEKVYPIDVDPHMAIKLYSSLPREFLDSLTPTLLGKNKYTYTFSKHLAEVLVQESGADLPSCIVRPAIVSGAHREPFPGWVDNFNGFGAVVVGAGKGVLRCLYRNKRGTVDLVPVDHVVNLTLAAAFHLGSEIKETDEVAVYTISSTQHPFVFPPLITSFVRYVEETPFNQIFCYPSLIGVKSRPAFIFLDFTLHYIPALLSDAASMLFRSTSKIKMLRVYKKTREICDTFAPALRTDYSFSTNNTRALFNTLSPADRETFNFDICSVLWEDYLKKAVYGYRRYACMEEDKDLPAAREDFKRYKMVYKACRLLVLLFGTSIAVSIMRQLLARTGLFYDLLALFRLFSGCRTIPGRRPV